METQRGLIEQRKILEAVACEHFSYLMKNTDLWIQEA
jgi:hypothetical protein